MTQLPNPTNLEVGNKQKYLGHKGLIVFMALMNMFIPNYSQTQIVRENASKKD